MGTRKVWSYNFKMICGTVFELSSGNHEIKQTDGHTDKQTDGGNLYVPLELRSARDDYMHSLGCHLTFHQIGSNSVHWSRRSSAIDR